MAPSPGSIPGRRSLIASRRQPAVENTHRESVQMTITKAILTDPQFWVPVVVLAVGIGLLLYIH